MSAPQRHQHRTHVTLQFIRYPREEKKKTSCRRRNVFTHFDLSGETLLLLQYIIKTHVYSVAGLPLLPESLCLFVRGGLYQKCIFVNHTWKGKRSNLSCSSVVLTVMYVCVFSTMAVQGSTILRTIISLVKPKIDFQYFV